MTKTIATIVIGAVLIGGTWWLGRIPEIFRSHKDSVFRWTPENIRENENPELWYKSARRELTEIRQDLANARLSPRCGASRHRLWLWNRVPPLPSKEEADFEAIVAGYFHDLQSGKSSDKPESKGPRDDWRFLRLLPCRQLRQKSGLIPHAIPMQ